MPWHVESRSLPHLLPFFSFFPLPWWERIKVRGNLNLLSSFKFKKPYLGYNPAFHPHPHLLPSREKEL